jgi:hypothetical protein
MAHAAVYAIKAVANHSWPAILRQRIIWRIQRSYAYTLGITLL